MVQRLLLLSVIIGLALRLAIHGSLGFEGRDWLANRIELSTPVSSFKRLREGVYLHSNGKDPYSGGVFHQSPLLLLLFGVIGPDNDGLIHALYLLVDVACACLLAKIAMAKNNRPLHSKTCYVQPGALAFLYLLHPFNIFSTSARSTSTFSNLFILLSIYSNTQVLTIAAAFALSLATQLSLYPILLFPALVMLQRQFQMSSAKRSDIIISISGFISHLALTTILCRLFLGSYSFLNFYRTLLTINDLTPNVGLSWYFFIEMFDHFRPFFLAVFQLHILAYVAPICIKVRNDPLLAITLITGIIATCKSYPNLGDIASFHCLVALFPELVPYMRYPLLSAALLLYSTCLLPTFHHLWLYAGSGNANFYYASTMVYGLGNGLLITDLLWAYLKKNFCAEQQIDERDRDIQIVQR